MDEEPKTLENEISVLGCMILEPKCIPEVMAMLRAESFSSGVHSEMFKVLCEGYREYGESTDASLLASRMLTVDREGSLLRLWEVAAGSVPSPTNFAYYAKQVLFAAAARTVWYEAKDYLRKVSLGEWAKDTQAFIDTYSNRVMRVGRTLASRLSGNTTAAQEVRASFDAAIEGRIRAVNCGYTRLNYCTNALRPGSITMLCGDPGAGKSMIGMQAMMFMHDAGESVALLQLESGRVMHLTRALAMRCYESSIDNPEWVRSHADKIRSIQAEHSDWLESFGLCCHDIPEGHASYERVAAWVESQAAAGARVLLVDPITAASPEDKPWIADRKLLGDLRNTLERHGASLVVVIHPKMGDHASEMAGGAAWKRHVDTVLWLKVCDEQEVMVVGFEGHPAPTSANRILMVNKARLGRGAGKKIAMWFDADTLRTDERGIVVEDQT